MYFLMTVDVESFSISLNREDPAVVGEVHEEGLPRLLNLLAKHDICGTFYKNVAKKAYEFIHELGEGGGLLSR
ncbi:MAG: hypothetical protein N2V77_01475 [Canidatus Methanoxibalbensis ujae]|nr:hypothetical protein [Candidatus Methanoxibalbensis ujae]